MGASDRDETSKHESGSASSGAISTRRRELSRELIMAAALDLIDSEGLHALSMRGLGVSLGAATMSVYRYFRNKAELLDAIVDKAISDLVRTPLEDTWQLQLKTIAYQVRSTILAHPNLAPLFAREFRRSPTSLHVNSTIVERMRTSGVPQSLLAETYWAIASYTNGYALWEARNLQNSGLRNPGARLRRATQIVRSVGEIPEYAVADIAHIISHPVDEAQFKFGLECLILGIEKKIATQD